MAITSKELEKAVSHLERGDWQAAHEIVQRDEESAVSCWAHGIVHILEGDLPNARYWYGQARRAFPAKPDAAAETHQLKKQISK